MHYHIVNHRMWTARAGTIRTALREYGTETALVAVYLFTSPHANQAGLYHCPLAYVAMETEQPPETIEQAILNLQKIHFCAYDWDAEVVWIYRMVRYQVPSWPGDKTDRRYRGVLNALQSVPRTHLVADFCAMWGVEGLEEGGQQYRQYRGHPSEGLARGFEGASDEDEPQPKIVGGES